MFIHSLLPQRRWMPLLFLVVAASLTSCDQTPHVSPAQALSTTITAGAQRSPEALAPAVAQQPVAAVCADVDAEQTTISLLVNPDTPIPRCVRVLVDQQLSIRNNTSTSIEVKLAQFDVQIASGASYTVDAPFGTYLAPGVHRVFLSSYPGSGGAEIWLVNEP
jgi:hypothetical protein